MMNERDEQKRQNEEKANQIALLSDLIKSKLVEQPVSDQQAKDIELLQRQVEEQKHQLENQQNLIQQLATTPDTIKAKLTEKPQFQDEESKK